MGIPESALRVQDFYSLIDKNRLDLPTYQINDCFKFLISEIWQVSQN